MEAFLILNILRMIDDFTQPIGMYILSKLLAILLTLASLSQDNKRLDKYTTRTLHHHPVYSVYITSNLDRANECRI